MILTRVSGVLFSTLVKNTHTFLSPASCQQNVKVMLSLLYLLSILFESKQVLHSFKVFKLIHINDSYALNVLNLKRFKKVWKEFKNCKVIFIITHISIVYFSSKDFTCPVPVRLNIIYLNKMTYVCFCINYQQTS